MVHQANTLNRRLERHHRVDGNLQARARPAALERKDSNANALVKEIRGFVERNADEAQNLGRRLLGGADRGFGDDPSSGGSSTSSSPGSSGNDGGDSGDNGSDTTSTSAVGRPGGFDTSRESTTSTRGGLGGLLGGGRTTSSSSSTSSTSSSTSSSTRTTSSSTRTTSSTSATPTRSALPSTSYAYVTSTPLPSLNAAAASSTPSESSSSGVGVGPIIGIVAGALAGVAVLAVIIGYLFKKFGRKEDPYESDPFDRDSFRRQSAMLPDTFEDDDRMPEMSEAHNVGPFGDEHGYMTEGAMGGAGAMALGGYAGSRNDGGPRPPTMFANHLNAPAAQMSMNDAPAVPSIGAIYTAGHDPSPQLPPMAFGGSDPYTIAGVGRQHMDSNVNNPYGYLDRQYSGSHSPPRRNEQSAHQNYVDVDRNGSQGSSGYQQQRQHYDEQYSAYEHHNTAGRPGTAEGRSGTPDLPNVQQTYAMGGDDTGDVQQHERVMSPHHQVTSPQHMSQELLSNGTRSNSVDPHGYRTAQSNSSSPPQQPLQVRNLLPNPSYGGQHQRPISAVSSVEDDDAAYGGVW